MLASTAAVSTVDNAATSDLTRTIVEAVRTSLSELDGHSVVDMTEDVELAELIGRLKALTGVLLAVVAR